MFIQNWIHGPTEVKQLGELGDKLERSRLEEMNLTTVVPHSLLSHSQHAHAQPPTSTYLLILTPPTHIPTSTFFCYLYPCSKDYPTSTILSSKCSYYHSLWSMHFSSKQALWGKLSKFFKTISIREGCTKKKPEKMWFFSKPPPGPPPPSLAFLWKI